MGQWIVMKMLLLRALMTGMKTNGMTEAIDGTQDGQDEE
jgi:hypothetical protein